jgi:Flp pilus assembly protein TadD
MAAVEMLSNHPAQALNTYRQILAKEYPKLGRAAVLSRLGVASRMAGDIVESERWLREASETSPTSAVSLAIARLEFGKTLDLEDNGARPSNNIAACCKIKTSSACIKTLRVGSGSPSTELPCVRFMPPAASSPWA